MRLPANQGSEFQKHLSENRDRERLRQLIARDSFEEGAFILASGRESKIFFDLKKTMLTHEGLNLLLKQVLSRIQNVNAEYIGGLAMGAVPLVTAAVLKSDVLLHPLDGFYVRKEPKTHGITDLIDGPLRQNSRVIIVDDVTTTGDSVLKAIGAVEGRRCKIQYVLTIVDRCEGAKAAVEDAGYNLDALYNRYDFTSSVPNESH